MNTYYIPTSTLNFNNILSTESISPKTFYTQRSFGIKRWTSVEENNLDDVILLYENAKSFSRDDSEIEDHPMLIAFMTEERFPQYTQGICYSDHTLYLDPWHTQFIFFSENDKRVTLSLSDSALEVKLLPLYKNRLLVRSYSEQYKPVQEEKDVVLQNEVSNEINKDTLINKLKGLLYGYYVGAYLSCTKDSIEDLWAFNRVHAYLANFISQGEKSPIKIDDVAFFEKYIADSKHRYLEPDESEIVLQDGRITSLKVLDKQDTKNLFIEWIKVFAKPEYGKDIIPHREAILADILVATEKYGDEKLTDTAKKYLQILQDQFDGIYSQKLSFNGVLLSAIAFVLLAGDSWEKLLQVMQREKIYDYRIPFAMYGCICGFADLYRTFTDYIINCPNRSYVAEVYTEFWGQLFGIHLDTSNTFNTDDSKVKIEHNRYAPIFAALNKISPELSEKFRPYLDLIPNDLSHEEEYKRLDNVWKQVKGDKTKCDIRQKNWRKIISDYKPQKAQNTASKGNEQGKTKQDSITTETTILFPHNETDSSIGNNFVATITPFYCDANAFECIKDIIPQKCQDVIRKDLKWFQDDYNENRKDTNNGRNLHGRYADRKRFPIDNRSVIENYKSDIEWQKRDSNPKTQWKREIYAKLDIDAIINRLKEIYK